MASSGVIHRRWKDAEVRQWSERMSLSSRLVEEKSQNWKRAINRYANRPRNFSVADSGVSVDLLYSNIQAKLPFIFFKNPDLVVQAENDRVPEERPAAVRATLQYFSRKNKLKRKINRGLLDAHLQQAMIHKVGYSTRHVGNVSSSKPGASGAAFSEPKPFFGRFSSRKSNKDTTSSETTENLRILHQGPVVWRVSPRRLLTHPDAELPVDEGCRWLSHMTVRPLEAVRRDWRYEMSFRKKIRPSAFPDSQMLGISEDLAQHLQRGKNDTSLQFVIMYEVWDMMTREVFVLAHDQPEIGPARSLDWPFKGMTGFPFVVTVPKEIPEEFWGMTELDPVDDQMQELDRVRTLQLRHLLRYQRKYAIATENIEMDTLDALRNGEDGALVEFDQEVARGAIEPIADAPLPADTYSFEARVKDDINEIMAVDEIRRGGTGANTATEASLLDQTATARSSMSIDQINDHLIEYYEKTLAICQQWLPQNFVVKIAGRLGESWTKLTPRDIAGQFELTVVPGSTQVPNRELLRAQAVNIFGMVNNDPLIDQVLLREMLLKQFPELIPQHVLDRLIKRPALRPEDVPPEELSRPGVELPEGTPGTAGAEDPAAVLQAAMQGGGGLG